MAVDDDYSSFYSKRRRYIIITICSIFILSIAVILPFKFLFPEYSISKVKITKYENNLLINDYNYNISYKLPLDWKIMDISDKESHWEALFHSNNQAFVLRFGSTKTKDKRALPYDTANYVRDKMGAKSEAEIKKAVENITYLTRKDRKKHRVDAGVIANFIYPEKIKDANSSGNIWVNEYLLAFRKGDRHYFFDYFIHMNEKPEHIKSNKNKNLEPILASAATIKFN